MFALIVCSSFGRSNGWTLGSAFRTQIQLNWRESRDRKREHIAFRSFIEWYRGNACKTLPFEYICVYQRAPRRVFFFGSTIRTHGKFYALLATAGLLFACMRHRGISLHFIFARVLSLYECACKQEESCIRVGLPGWLVGWWRFGCLHECVCGTRLQIDMQATEIRKITICD